MTQKRVKASDVIGNSYYIYTLQSSNNTPSLNSTINITCNVTDVYGQAISGKSITLYQNNTSKGAKTTDSSGNASWNSISMSSAGLQVFKVENSKIEVFVDNKSDVGHTHSQYLTEHQSIKTINNESLIGVGNIDLSTNDIQTIEPVNGTIDFNSYTETGKYATFYYPSSTSFLNAPYKEIYPSNSPIILLDVEDVEQTIDYGEETDDVELVKQTLTIIDYWQWKFNIYSRTINPNDSNYNYYWKPLTYETQRIDPTSFINLDYWSESGSYVYIPPEDTSNVSYSNFPQGMNRNNWFVLLVQSHRYPDEQIVYQTLFTDNEIYVRRQFLNWVKIGATVDATWVNNSTNPIQSKVIKDALDNKLDKTHSSYKGKNVVTNATTGDIEFEDKPTIPSASSTTPSADTENGSVGSGTTWARSNHTHPKSSIYAEASHTHSQYLTSHQSLDSKTVTVEKLSTATSGYLSSYAVKQNGVQVGNTIDIPKDFLVKSGSVKTVVVDNHPVSGYSAGDRYIDFVINTKDNSGTDEHMYILVSDLVQDNGIEYINGTHSDTSTFIFTGNSYVFNSVSDIKDGSMIIYRVPVTSTNDSNYLKLQITCKGASGYGTGGSTAYIMKNNAHVTASQYPINTKLLLMYQNGWNIIGQTNLDDAYATANHTHNQYLTSHQDISGKEDISNKVSSWNSTTTDINYPSEKLVKDSLDLKSDATHTHGNITNDGKITTTDSGQFAYFVGVGSSGSNLYKANNLNANCVVDNTAHSNIDTSASANQSTINTAIDSTLGNKENTSNKVTSLSSSSTDTQYPSAKLVYDQLATKTNVSDIKNNLTSTDTNKPLSANQGKELKALIDNKEDNIYRIVGTEVSSPSSASARLHCGTLPFDNISGKIFVYVVPDISTLSASQKALIYGSYPSGGNISYNIFKSNNEYLTIGDIQTGDELLLMYEGNARVISNSSISNKEDSNNKVSSWSSTTNNIRYPTEKLVKDSLDGKANTNHTHDALLHSNDDSDVLIFEPTAQGYPNGEGIPLGAFLSEFWRTIYPVGSIYMSVNSTSPATLFGGTWEQIEDTFLLASGNTYNAGSTGGSADAVVVSHNHTQASHTHTTSRNYPGIDSSTNWAYSSKRQMSSTSGSYYYPYSTADTNGISEPNTMTTVTPTINSQGVSGTGKNMPPYLAVYVWKRTA